MVLVSVIIPSYQRFEDVVRCIRSVQNQTHKELEIIVIDDCSQDPRYKELDILFKEDARVKILHLPINQRIEHKAKAAQGMTRNHGLRIATGEYIAFLDDDDEWVPEKTEIELKHLQENKDCLLIASNMYNVKRNDVNYRALHHDFWRIHGQLIANNLKKIQLRDIHHMNPFPNSSVMIHRSMYEKVGEQRVEVAEDYQYWKRILSHTHGLFVNMPLVLYQIHEQKHYSYA